MNRQIWALALLIGSAGCATQDVAMIGNEPREAISAAATASYPKGAQATSTVKLVAFNYAEKKVLEIHNLSDHSVPASTVWVNEAFLTPIASIPPKSYATVKYTDLLEAGHAVNDMTKGKSTITKVELQGPDGLMSVEGPAEKL